MTEGLFAAYLFSLGLTCFTVYVCFRCIAWVVANGWRSMLGLVALRGEAVLIVDESDDIRAGLAANRCPTEYDPDVKDRADWDVHVDTALDVLLTHEATPDVDEFGQPERWVALEEEFADLDDLAAQLGERAQ